MRPIAVFGGGGFGKEVQAWIQQIGGWEFIGFFDDNKPVNSLVNDAPVLGGLEELNCFQYELDVVFAIGDPVIKKRIIESLTNKKIKFPVLIHPSAVIGNPKYVEIGAGTIIAPNTVVTTNIVIGKHVALNYSCTVGHDTAIKDFSAFMPCVSISGEVEIGECVYVGTGARVINRKNIGDNTVVGAGAVVTKSLPEYCTAVGVPARPIKYHRMKKAG
ncbi:MAG TPA: acetyltransferase [Ignavibacteriales bacterium]|nr:acetyltransferase [Ignavibacteriales bacterium]